MAQQKPRTQAELRQHLASRGNELAPRVNPSTGQKVKAAGTVVKGGGLENPVTDAKAAKTLVSKPRATPRSSSGTSASTSRSRSSASSSSPSSRTGTSRSSGQRSTSSKQQQWGRWAKAPARRALLAEFVICEAVVGLSVLGLDDKSTAGSHMARRASGLCALFFLLAVLAGFGPGQRKVANALGLLVTVGYLTTERKSFTALGNYFAGTADKSSTGTEPA